MFNTNIQVTGPVLRVISTIAVVGTLAMAATASAHMRTISRGELADLDRQETTSFQEYYEHPDLGSFEFTGIYLEHVSNQVRSADIYDMDLRPERVDRLMEDFHALLRNELEASGLLRDEPGPRTLVISNAVIEIGEYHEFSTGTHLARTASANRVRGGAIIEMVWRAGPGGDVLLALRDSRGPSLYEEVSDHDDTLTDARHAFQAFAVQLAGFFSSAD